MNKVLLMLFFIPEYEYMLCGAFTYQFTGLKRTMKLIQKCDIALNCSL